MGSAVLEFLFWMGQRGMGVDWENLDGSDSGYLKVELVGLDLDLD